MQGYQPKRGKICWNCNNYNLFSDKLPENADVVLGECEIHGVQSHDFTCADWKRIYRGVQINFRLYGDEFATVEKNAENAGLSVYEYAKKAALGVKVKPPMPPKVKNEIAQDIAATLRKMYAELQKQGGNLNQIAKFINYGGEHEYLFNQNKIYEELQRLEAVKAELQAITRGVDEIWRQLN